MLIRKQIGTRLKALRKSAGFKSARSFAAFYKIPATTYAQHESGSRALNVDLILKYSDLLGVDCSWLLTGKGTPFIKSNISDYDEKFGKEQKKTDVVDSKNLSALSKKQYALVDMFLFSKILKSLIKFLHQFKIELETDELVDFVISVYNDLIFITATDEEKENLIDISLLSIKNINDKKILDILKKEEKCLSK